MKNLLLLAIILPLTSCGFLGIGGDGAADSLVAVPVGEFGTVGGWVTRQGPGVDYDQDGFVTDVEWTVFMAWLYNQTQLTFPGPAPGQEPLMTPEERRAAAIEEARANEKPIPEEFRVKQ